MGVCKKKGDLEGVKKRVELNEKELTTTTEKYVLSSIFD